MSQENPRGEKSNTYLEDAFALANAWDSRKRHEPEAESRDEKPREKRGSHERRATLEKSVPEINPRTQNLRDTLPTVQPNEKRPVHARRPVVARPADDEASTTRTLDIPVVVLELEGKAAHDKALADQAARSQSRKAAGPEQVGVAATAAEQPATAGQRGPSAGVRAAGEAKAADADSADADSADGEAALNEGGVEGAAEEDAGATQKEEDGPTKRKSVDPSKRAVANPKKAEKDAAAKASAEADDAGRQGAENAGAAKKKAPRPKKAKGSGSVLKIVGVAVAVLIIAAIGVASYASFNRWVLSDDAADIQGVWRTSGSTSNIEISDSTIDLAGEAAFKYVIDPGAKNIYETMANVSGEARYRFSGDRQSLALFDEGAVDWIDTAKRDFDWFMSCIWAKVSGAPDPDLLGGESGVILYRQSGTGVSNASEAD